MMHKTKPKLRPQIDCAVKTHIPFFVIVGDELATSGQLQLKNMTASTCFQPPRLNLPFFHSNASTFLKKDKQITIKRTDVVAVLRALIANPNQDMEPFAVSAAAATCAATTRSAP